MHCSDVKPTTRPKAGVDGVDGMKIKATTKPSTVRVGTTQLISSQQPPPTQLKSTQTPLEPEIDYLEKEKEAAEMSGRYYQ